MKDKLKEFFIKDKFYTVLLAGIIINIFCFCVFSCNPLVVHAASEQTYYPIIQNANNSIPNNVLTWFQQNQYQSGCHFVIYGPYATGTISGSTYYEYYFVRWNSSYDSSIRFVVQNDGHSVYVQKSGSVSGFNNGLIRYQTSNNQIFVSTSNGGNIIYSPLVLQSSSYNSNVSWVSNFDVLDTSGNVLLFLVAPIEIPEGGDPSAPDMSSLDLDSSLNTTTIPSAPTYSNNFNDPLPTYDSSAPFSSLFDIIIWGFNRVHSVFQSFREYLFSWLGYFINILTYLIQKIIDAIKYIVNWLYNQFLNWLTPYLKIWSFISGLLFNEDDQKSVFDLILDFFGSVAQWLAQFWQNSFIVEYWNNLNDLFDDVLTKIDNVVTAIDNLRILFTADPDYSLIITQFYSTYIGQIYQAIMRLLTAIFDGFKSVQAPATLSFTVNFASAPAPFNQVGYLTFDFNWYEGIRSVIVPIVTTCIYFGFGLHIAWSWRSMLFDTASLKPDVTIRPLGSTPMGSKSYAAGSSSSGGGLVPTWRTYPGQKRLRG